MAIPTRRVRTIFGIVLLTALLASLVPAQLAQAADPPYKIFLPIISKPFVGISGIATNVDGAAFYQPLDLLFYNDSAWSVLLSTSTDGDGAYRFYPPSLQPGQAYCVRYVGLVPSDLAVWFSPIITQYSSSGETRIPDFNIGNVYLKYPGSDATLSSLPQGFEWIARWGTPTDSYQVELFDPESSVDFKSPMLGYVDGYLLEHFPPGFSHGHAYGWTVVVNSPDGGYGLAYYYRPIYFGGRGSHLFNHLSIGPQQEMLLHQDWLIPHWTP